MRNFPILFSFLLIGYVTGFEWDAVITTDSGILFFDKNWTQISSGGHQFQHISAFAYDEVKSKLYFSDLKDPNYRLFSLDTNPEEEYHKITKLLPKLDETAYITGLVFDHLERKLYWTERGTHSVYAAEVDKLGSNGNDSHALIQLVTQVEEDHDLAALTIDECRRHLYWTNSFLKTSSIVQAAMNGSVLKSYQKDVYQPKGISIDHYNNRIYWVEKKYGRAFSIESADLEIENQQTFLTGYDKVPTHVSLDTRFLYWIDQEDDEVHETLKTDPTVNRVIYKGNSPSAVIIRSSLLLEFHKNNPRCADVVSQIVENVRRESAGEVQPIMNATDSKTGRIICLNNGILNHNTNSCICLAEYQGNFCEIPICNNFCVHGECIVGVDSRPVCKCNAEFEGERCDRNKCDGYCLNNGRCLLSASGETSCTCSRNFSGARCETVICTSDYCYNGECYVEGEVPKCKCNVGYRGERCEEYTCNNYCLNDGKCVLNNETMLVECRCSEEYTGKRCEIPKRFCSLDTDNPELQPYCEGITSATHLVEPQVTYCKNSFNRTVVYTSLAFTASLFILMIILWIVRRFYEEGRPRITKRFKVTNHTQMTSRPATQCEITIENCCNMNVCETPCFDTKLLQKASSKADDKQYLLDDIESLAGSYRKLPSCSGEKSLP
ncbi:protein cueball isoform X2 [Topomyia yanbarensis]|uniref:protein cueball isoform X2 n=1 Tax=Topomyia yanbarensis TaxID=2498891 RepID=UPI00273B91F3|nr:protein cueball isoform X2 [Topomyia yanbarensis]